MRASRGTLRLAVTAVRTAAVGAVCAAAWAGGFAEVVPTLPAEAPAERPGLLLPALDRKDFPGCVALERFEGIPGSLVVVTEQGAVVRMGLDKVAARVENADQADDVWTIGACH